MSTMLHGFLPGTEYREVTSRAGRRYGVWITTPVGYADSDQSLPLIYVLDGNFTVGLTAPLAVVQSVPYLDIAPYIQVCVGYAGEEAAQWVQLRNRDLVPPGEPIGDEEVAALEAARDAGTYSQEEVDAYLRHVADARGDEFFDFLVTELHPGLRADLRVSESGHGLFGSSYGGLFALYAWLRGGTPFATVGAGSPGIMNDASQVFDLVRTLDERIPGHGDHPRLHVTLNQAEILGDVPVYRAMAIRVLTALERIRATGRVESLSTAMLDDTHVTGVQGSFLSYLKQCHVR